eukprot:CAMPEP_0176009902 /NCGR_PEP_ID=MMETSP0120_2-20121206/4489_1 /TAXON_ID=160619 /ORGANISM="Kryptoperidinium foliaceum, Strain CCMP 1326" /LENGTH=148 /DNA_ID=CAMNT_0017342711 /DNA_START=1 /DNA_END=444 /DNA_ORIENTATION=+
MSAGQRVLAIAYREMKQDEAGSSKSLQHLERESVENNLKFAGFLLMDSPVKADSKPVISELAKSGHTCYMITGDALLTAASVARQVGIIANPDAALYQIDKISGGGDEPSGIDAFGFVRLSASTENKTDDQLLRGPLSIDSLKRASAL